MFLGSAFFRSLEVSGFGGYSLGGHLTAKQTATLKNAANTTLVTRTVGVAFGEMISSELLML